MFVFRQVGRYFRSLFTFKKLILLVLVCFVVGFSYFAVNGNGYVCETDGGIERNIKDIPSKQLEKLKQKWMAEQQSLNSKVIVGDEPPNTELKSFAVSTVECLINDDYPIQCLKSNDGTENVFMPFSFIGKYFEITGKMKHYDGYDRFEFLQSYAKVIYEPKVPYNYHGVFMTFDSYDVENRDRVLCVAGVEGVPVSTQWGHPHFYTVQISQFGLSHYSKHLGEKTPLLHIYEDAENSVQAKWKATNRYCSVEKMRDKITNGNVVKFRTPDSIPLGSGVTLTIGNTVDHELSFDVRFSVNGSISVVLDTVERKKKQYTIHYITDSVMIDYDQRSNIFYGIGSVRNWRRISRNLLIDLRKGVVFGTRKAKDDQRTKKAKLSIQKISRVIIRGEGFIDNITISKTAHMTYFRDASDWVMKHQDASTGGWKNDIERTLRDGFKPLPPGWISAMGQGQAMSLLSRAYYVYGDKLYIKALSRALLPFTVPSQKGGVRAVFMDKYAWYEEYPTTPSSFVLNGFIYSLIGLYDFKSLLEDKLGLKGTLETEVVEYFRKIDVDLIETYKLVTTLYDEGMASLKAMLPLYDGGSRTFYDLRHFILKVQPNVARWDYHTTHLSQLALLSTISDDTIFKRYFEYWHGYMKGKVASHN